MDALSPTSLQHLFHAYGLWVLFIVVMLESMGIPMPGETALVTAALYAGSTHRIDIVPVVLVAATGAIIGDNIGYLIGRSIGAPLLMRYGRYVRLDEARLKVGQYLFLRHGGKIVFFGRFVAFLRAFAALLAGANRMAVASAVIMSTIYVSIVADFMRCLPRCTHARKVGPDNVDSCLSIETSQSCGWAIPRSSSHPF